MIYSTIISVFSIFFFNVLNVFAQNTTNNPQNVRLDSPNNIDQFHTVIYYSITMSVIGLCGCIYVFYRTYKQWKLNGKRLKMIYRLPFYTACSGKNHLNWSFIMTCY
jgi:cellobiose-specific phosphotransferase system component IIC